MLASEYANKLMALVAKHGDQPLAIDDGGCIYEIGLPQFKQVINADSDMAEVLEEDELEFYDEDDLPEITEYFLIK